jgi:predicted transglutaminase-like cysteine proteinase
MRLNPSIVIGLLGILGFAAAGSAQAETAGTLRLAALPAPSAAAPALGAARPIAAWVEFCQRYRAECALDTREAEIVTLTPETWALVGAVNRGVNHEIRAVTDVDHWGVPDRWDLAEDGAGDCEDYQLLKRHRLAAAGLPRRAMRMTVVLDEENEGHAVLMLRTDRGDLVLDNKTDTVLPWHRTGYTYIKRESADAVTWVSLGGATSPTMTANR